MVYQLTAADTQKLPLEHGDVVTSVQAAVTSTLLQSNVQHELHQTDINKRSWYVLQKSGKSVTAFWQLFFLKRPSIGTYHQYDGTSESDKLIDNNDVESSGSTSS